MSCISIIIPFRGGRPIVPVPPFWIRLCCPYGLGCYSDRVGRRPFVIRSRCGEGRRHNWLAQGFAPALDIHALRDQGRNRKRERPMHSECPSRKCPMYQSSSGWRSWEHSPTSSVLLLTGTRRATRLEQGDPMTLRAIDSLFRKCNGPAFSPLRNTIIRSRALDQSTSAILRTTFAFRGQPATCRYSTVAISSLNWQFLPFARSLKRDIRDIYSRPTRSSWTIGQGGPPPGGKWWQRLGRRLDRIPHNAVFWTILGLNGLVFVMWKIALKDANRFGDGKLLTFMFLNFTNSWAHFGSGRFWTLVTSCFSQITEGHLIFNCVAFAFAAPTLLSTIGSARFLLVYMGGGVVGSLLSIFWRWGDPGVSVGASGSVLSVLSLLTCMFPRSRIYLFFIIPMPAWVFISGLFLYDGYRMLFSTRTGGGTDTSAHIGGLLTGIAFYFRMRAGGLRW